MVLKPEPIAEIRLMYGPGGCFLRKSAAGAESQLVTSMAMALGSLCGSS